MEYCALFRKQSFLAQIGELAVWIGHLRRKRLKPEIIKGYLAGFCSFHIDCILDLTKLEIYNYLILHKIIASL